ncbi:hypothetical protein FA13DRAFT_1010441 [Coprinellus micaceus]|uniref:Uncharacterized protein n=1 Tax=Coprinellus micaceus TaxID=71717 RepID=A0A4Y7SY11_COPMI|nr:hypothetical protein FA13DRAFT_1010441 [Coprinellus micaceus]
MDSTSTAPTPETPVRTPSPAPAHDRSEDLMDSLRELVRSIQFSKNKGKRSKYSCLVPPTPPGSSARVHHHLSRAGGLVDLDEDPGTDLEAGTEASTRSPTPDPIGGARPAIMNAPSNPTIVAPSAEVVGSIKGPTKPNPTAASTAASVSTPHADPPRLPNLKRKRSSRNIEEGKSNDKRRAKPNKSVVEKVDKAELLQHPRRKAGKEAGKTGKATKIACAASKSKAEGPSTPPPAARIRPTASARARKIAARSSEMADGTPKKGKLSETKAKASREP